ncbi:histidine phosphatase family protein [Megalodesulfovibrio paquesii]
MIFGMLRHGETVWNVDKRIQGQTEHPLSDLGREEARSWGRALAGQGWRRILVSDLGRAMETAALINESLHLPVVSDARLREQDWGQWVGKTVKELCDASLPAVQEQENRGWEFRPPGGESRTEVLARVLAALGDHALGDNGSPCLVVAHKGVLKCLAYHCLGWTFLPHEPDPLKPHRLHRFSWVADETGGRLLILNLNERLEPASA